MVVLAAREPGPVDIRSRDLCARLAEAPEEVFAAQELRYQVFIKEMSATPTSEMRAAQREFDLYDEFCDHLIVYDQRYGGPTAKMVSTCRIMRRTQADLAGGFYTAGEYDISKLLAHPGELMELGRSCVDPAYRSGANMQLVWRAMTAYALYYDVQLLFGCGSFHSVEPETLAAPLSYLHHNHLGPSDLCPRALANRYSDMNLLPPDSYDEKDAWQTLPPLVKGYLRLGGYVGDGAVVDHEFGTTDVCVVVKSDKVTSKYRRHLTRPPKDEVEFDDD